MKTLIKYASDIQELLKWGLRRISELFRPRSVLSASAGFRYPAQPHPI